MSWDHSGIFIIHCNKGSEIITELINSSLYMISLFVWRIRGKQIIKLFHTRTKSAALINIKCYQNLIFRLDFHCHLFIQETSSCNLSFSKCYYYSGYSILFIVVTIKFIDSIVRVSSLIGYNSLDGDCHEQRMKWNGRCWVDSRWLLWNWTVYWEGR